MKRLMIPFLVKEVLKDTNLIFDDQKGSEF